MDKEYDYGLKSLLVWIPHVVDTENIYHNFSVIYMKDR